MWCVAKLDAEYIERMENLLSLYAKPADENEPMVCLDEKPVVLHKDVRKSKPMRPGKPHRRDYEYKRQGTANVFCITEPKLGIHLTHATEGRKTPAFASALLRILERFPEARKIHLVVDNLSTHFLSALKNKTDLGDELAQHLWDKFEVHYTPKHGSWLNQAEIEVGLWTRECMAKRRFENFENLRRHTDFWNDDANEKKRTVEWKFRSEDAQHVFGYSTVNKSMTEH